MDTRKEYEKSNTEERISRLAKPQRMYIFLPLVILMTLALHSIFDANTPFSDVLKNLLNPVALIAIAAMIIPGIKLDKDSRRLYQALCAPVDNMDMKHIFSLIDTRHRTLQFIRIINAAAILATYFMIYSSNISGVHYACLLGVTTNYLGDKKRIIEKLNEDIAA